MYNIIFKEYNDIIFSSKSYELDGLNWGIYLFEFINCKNEKYKPNFDMDINLKLETVIYYIILKSIMKMNIKFYFL